MITEGSLENLGDKRLFFIVMKILARIDLRMTQKLELLDKNISIFYVDNRNHEKKKCTPK